MKAHLLNDDIELNTKIYRYYDFDKFVKLLNDCCLYLVDVKRWDDPFETLIEKCIVSDSETNELIMHKSVHAQCWSFCKESDAMWRIYGKGLGIKIETTISEILNLDYPNRTEIGKVYYTNSLDCDDSKLLSTSGSYFGTAFLKRTPFSHEEEIRIVTVGNDSDHTMIEFDISSFIKNIVIDPRATIEFEDSVRELCNEYGLECMKSSLYDCPNHEYILSSN